MIPLQNVNWNQVYYFYEVAKRLSMSKAAAFLDVSVPTISDQVKRLEASLNAKTALMSLPQLPPNLPLVNAARMFTASRIWPL